MARDTSATDQVQIALLLLKPSWNCLLTIGYIAFDIWAWSIKQGFTLENRITDARTATAVFVFLLLSTIICGARAIYGWGCFFLRAPKERKDSVGPASSRKICLAVTLVPILVTPTIFLCVVAWKWFGEFHANGEATNAAYSAVLGTISALILLFDVVVIAIAVAGYCTFGQVNIDFHF